MAYAMIDIDKFKLVNDTYGHLMGDYVIKGLAHLLKHRLRKSDVVGRYGGEEFAVILPDCNLDAAIKIIKLELVLKRLVLHMMIRFSL